MKNVSKKWIFITLFVIIGAGTWSFVIWKSKTAEKVTYKDYQVVRGSLDSTILATGTVQPENRLQIKSPVSGRADKVLVNEGDRVKKGQVLVWMSSTERAALLDAATAKGPEELAEWEQMYKPTPILAPIDGMIISRNIESGQTFTNQDAVLVMSDRLTVKAQVDETDIAKIALKQAAQIILDAYPDEKIDAKVDQIAFDAKTVNNVTNYLVDVLPVKTPAFLRSGMTANVTFLVASKKDVLYVPAEAIKTLNGKSMIMPKTNTAAKGPDQSVTVGDPLNGLREIKIGLSDGKKIEVLDGLTENEIILIPEFKLVGANKQSSPFSPMGPTRQRGH